MNHTHYYPATAGWAYYGTHYCTETDRFGGDNSVAPAGEESALTDQYESVTHAEHSGSGVELAPPEPGPGLVQPEQLVVEAVEEAVKVIAIVIAVEPVLAGMTAQVSLMIWTTIQLAEKHLSAKAEVGMHITQSSKRLML